MAKEFKIYQRHYDIIIKQAYDNMPNESGGFLGGTDDTIKGIMPAFNRHLGTTTDTFSITSDDIFRAHEFFYKHKLKFLGIYHTHPNGVAIPSAQDLKNSQKYLFIIGVRSPGPCDFAVYETHGYSYNRVPLYIEPDAGISVVDIKDGGPVLPKNDLFSEMNNLNSLMQNIRNQRPNYNKLGKKTPFDDNEFMTFA